MDNNIPSSSNPRPAPQSLHYSAPPPYSHSQQQPLYLPNPKPQTTITTATTSLTHHPHPPDNPPPSKRPHHLPSPRPQTPPLSLFKPSLQPHTSSPHHANRPHHHPQQFPTTFQPPFPSTFNRSHPSTYSSQQPSQFSSKPTSTYHRSEPFPNSKSLPFPITCPNTVAQSSVARPVTSSQLQNQHFHHHPPIPVITSAHAQTHPHQPQNQTQTQHHVPDGFVLYDIAKLHAAKCAVIAGKVYNDKGHSICGVLNQHDKPCRRIGKCPFHGVSVPVSADNSSHGVVDAMGTAVVGGEGTEPTGEEVNSPLALRGPESLGPNLEVPKKQQYKHGWSKEEHYLFLRGLVHHERGSWKQISNMVQSRNATQVQSHAQKYFLRQKQNNKNKRSIHDLTMDSPEMQEMERRFRTGRFRHVIPIGAPLGDVYNMNMSDALPGKSSPVVSPMPIPPSTNDNIHHPITSDINPRYASSASALASKYGQGQAMSATTLGSTLGSSLSSAVHVAQLSAVSNGSVPSSQKKIDQAAYSRSVGTPQSREVHMSAAKTAFSTYHNNNPTNISSAMPAFSPKPEHRVMDVTISGTAADRGGDAHNDNTNAQLQPMYSPNGFQSLYAQANGAANALFYQSSQQQRVNGADNRQTTLHYTSDIDNRRQNNGNGGAAHGKDSFQIQSPFAGIQALPVTDGFGGVGAGSTGEHALDGNGAQPNQNFASGLFTHPEAVGEGTHGYGVTADAQGNVPNLMNGFSANGLHLGGVRGHNGMQNSFSRN